MRPCVSVTGTRCTRCTPPSNLRRLKAPFPWTSAMTSLKPPSPVGLDDEHLDPPAVPLGVARCTCGTARRRRALASSPPVPARISSTVLRSSFGSRGRSSCLQPLVERGESRLERGQLGRAPARGGRRRRPRSRSRCSSTSRATRWRSRQQRRRSPRAASARAASFANSRRLAIDAPDRRPDARAPRSAARPLRDARASRSPAHPARGPATERSPARQRRAGVASAAPRCRTCG